MAPTLNLALREEDLKEQAWDILLEEGDCCIGLLRLGPSPPKRRFLGGGATVHLRPGVIEDLAYSYSLRAETERQYKIGTISDSAGPYSGLLLAFERQFWRVPEWRLGRVTLVAIGPLRP